MREKALFGVLCVMALAGTAMAANVWVVDDDLAECPAANFTTFQAAYTAAANGDTIRMCAGTYAADRFFISKTLTILGPQAGIDPRPGRAGGEAVFVAPTPAGGVNGVFEVWADYVVFDGVTFASTQRALRVMDGGTGFVSVNNVFRDLYEAVWFDRDTYGCVVNQNLILGLPSPARVRILLFYDGYEEHYDDEITNNDVIGATNSHGVYGSRFGYMENLTVRGNRFIGNRTGLLIHDLNRSVIEDNEILGNGSAGIFAGMHDVAIRRNKILDNDAAPQETEPGSGVYVAYGILVLDDYYAQPASDHVTIEWNRIAGNILGVYAMANADADTIVAHYNCIYDNSMYGVLSENGLGALDATLNYWGSAAGPTHATQWSYFGSPYGPYDGGGDAVSDYVLYDDWLTICFDEFACPKTIGFWKQQVEQSPAAKYSQAEIGAIVARALSYSPVFASPADLTTALLSKGNAGALLRAKRQFAALSLNLAALDLLGDVDYPAGLGFDTPLDLPALTAADTVGEAFLEVEGYLLAATNLGLANDLADAVNNGWGIQVHCGLYGGDGCKE